MKVRVTKRQVIKALKTEPLRSGQWVHYEIENKELYKNNTKCPVCAVGAILDSVLGKDFSPKDLNMMGLGLTDDPMYAENLYDTQNILQRARKLIEREKPLSALSSLFEGLSQMETMQTKHGFANYRLRRILVNFVNKNFPSTLVLDTNESL